jgi:hypothetical protein
VERASRLSRLAALATPAARDDDGAPVKFDRDVDHEFPRRLFSAWKPAAGPRELRRPMRDDELAAVQARAAALEIALEPHDETDDRQVAAVESAIGGMLGGFRQMRQEGQNMLSTIEVVRGVLRPFPAWAIVRACLRLARRETGLDPRYAPNDAQIADEVRSILKPYREAMVAAQALLDAPVEEARPPRADVPRPSAAPALPPPLEGDRAARLKADLEERRARNAAGAPE